MDKDEALKLALEALEIMTQPAPVQKQALGFEVVLDESLPPNTMKFAQPAVPTKEMIDAAERIDWADSDVRGNIINIWQAMTAAAPEKGQP